MRHSHDRAIQIGNPNSIRIGGYDERMTIPEMFSLRGKVAIVTGGARYLGCDIAEVFAEAGCALVITSHRAAAAERAARSLRSSHHAEVLPLRVDITILRQVRALARRAQAWKGQVDILVNNAGGTPEKGPRHLFERRPGDIVKLLAVNLIGSLLCCREIGRIMAQQGHGKIVNIASVAGLVGRDRRMYQRHGMRGQPVDYAAAKAGVIGMTRDLAALLSPMGIHVNSISPGGFARDNLPPAFVRDYSRRTPLGHMGRPGIDLKGAVLFLASAASDYITGHNLVVDGGFSIWQ